MLLIQRFTHLLMIFSVIFLLNACSSKGNDFYKHQPSLPPLEVPPDLTLINMDTGFEIPEVATVVRKQVVLSDGGNVSLEKDGRLRWLTIAAAPDDVWEEVKNYWITNKVPLKWQYVKLGIMETDWINSSDSDYVLDRYRVRLESKNNGETTELYLSHRAKQETMIDGVVADGWIENFTDPELEIEVLGDMLVYLGLNNERKTALLDEAKSRTEDARLVLGADVPHILMSEPYQRSWKFTLQAVDRMGNIISQRDKKLGWLDVRITNHGVTTDFTPGFALSDQDRDVFRLQLQQEGEQTRINVLNDEGQLDRSEIARKFLEQLHSYL